MSVDVRYPIGKFELPKISNRETRHEWITAIAVLPRQLSDLVRDMSDEELETRYRPDGWTVRQVVHHIADSHLNAYVRFRLALTEDEPVIKPYNEALWANLPDARTMPAECSLQLLTFLHARWVSLLKSLDDAAFQRVFTHPELGKRSLEETTALYAWHGRHHLAHVRIARGLFAQAAV